MRIDTGMAGRRMVYIECQSVAPGRDTDAGDVPVLDGDDGFVDHLLCLEIDPGMEMIIS